jgi:PhnB protein
VSVSGSYPSSNVQRASITATLAVRGGARAVDFYRAAFGAVEEYRVGDAPGPIVARLSVAGADFWVADESPEHLNFSPETLGGCSVRMLLIVDDPDAVHARAVAAGAAEVVPVAEEHGWRLAGSSTRSGITGRSGRGWPPRRRDVPFGSALG